VTSHALGPFPLSPTVTPSKTPSTLERDVLYGRPLWSKFNVSRFSRFFLIGGGKSIANLDGAFAGFVPWIRH